MILPEAVQAELFDHAAPRQVRMWIASPPPWMEAHATPGLHVDMKPPRIHEGEKAAIALAYTLKADLLPMDDRKAVSAAEKQGLRVTGTLGVLDRAAERGLIWSAPIFGGRKR